MKILLQRLEQLVVLLLLLRLGHKILVLNC